MKTSESLLLLISLTWATMISGLLHLGFTPVAQRGSYFATSLCHSPLMATNDKDAEGFSMHQRMDDWGPLALVKVKSGADFWGLFEELCDDKSGFVHNRNFIAQAYRDGHLYCLRVVETDSMFERGPQRDSLFVTAPGTLCLLPCFCIAEDKSASIIWVHTRARRKGFARSLIVGYRHSRRDYSGI
ncbi:hypothetical protein JKP88DRAFT_206573 [Tribonema minus]|uniref:Uncharacterized protein n=1 Tax=Tribonema minus TaxID=303371 RepID=A0A836CKJ9_9STRA|nr:hypothetical protein JKP88DRAFT_206573 [Tribonema minus]